MTGNVAYITNLISVNVKQHQIDIQAVQNYCKTFDFGSDKQKLLLTKY
jgi:hypothetical protein